MKPDRPWMTALEKQFGVLNVLRRELAVSPMSQDIRDRMIIDCDFLRCAETYAWSSDTAAAVRLASRSIPKDTRQQRGLIPGSGVGWWWFDVPVVLTSQQSCIAVLYGLLGDDLYLRPIIVDEGMWKQAVTWTWDGGTTISQMLETLREDAERQSVDFNVLSRFIGEITRLFVAGCVWLQQRVVTISHGHIERHRRKQLVREHDAELASDVKVVQLRRTEAQSHQNGDGEYVEWSCRWIVGGHWRNQPYKDERKLIYIMPYVKGPADLPLKVPKATVYAVNR